MSLICALAFPFALWIVLGLSMRHSAYSMDQGGHKGSFFPLLILYQVFFYILAIIAGCNVVFCYGRGFVWSGMVTATAAAEALIFNIVLLAFYESFLHYREGFETSNYWRWKYALVSAFGVSALITFFAGMGMTALAAVAERMAM